MIAALWIWIKVQHLSNILNVKDLWILKMNTADCNITVTLLFPAPPSRSQGEKII